MSIYEINRRLEGSLGIRILSSRAERYFQHEKMKFVSPNGHVISTISHISLQNFHCLLLEFFVSVPCYHACVKLNSGHVVPDRTFNPKMFATDEPRCPVKIFKEYLAKRPPEMASADSPLYLASIVKASFNIWFKKQSLGKKKSHSVQL